jgi:hypothetical protein
VSGVDELSLRRFGAVCPDQSKWISFFGRRYDMTYAELARDIGYKVMCELVWLIGDACVSLKSGFAVRPGNVQLRSTSYLRT